MGKRFFIGVDEVGRGALAGPLVVAAVAFQGSPPRVPLWNAEDSKALTASRREVIAEQLRAHSRVRYALAGVGNRTIDQIGIGKAASLAVSAALTKIQRTIGAAVPFVLLDGGLVAPAHFSQLTVIYGDVQLAVIAAASIIAKVHRDRLMEAQHEYFPQYHFAAHKGYGTAGHYAALRRHGPSPLHRRTFRLA
ncbi:MAG: hypothetical protein A2991_02695 [Candidatus Terrybacteria bacterium RIFCSPLOWO2_01_FULL_58_14]|uniref:Ribonuclease HII n=2 Tax=Candidatus Terryibacteriota TaxID=1817920 RepID=A0A1G2Q0P7_9BACT|nr:MAG: hypothetical protein A2682_00215 [Candidatus Terrybacteria bacterium RIFCSPHIGHO2_01_FULL_58_15]OHA54154.1 MAG: hypothetical protein A2991_02695 [Candidatus Terrybacteria bacterium RIFCSPLOWO2_01_FULL_58_14]